jgi:hypothetical protein
VLVGKVKRNEQGDEQQDTATAANDQAAHKVTCALQSQHRNVAL